MAINDYLPPRSYYESGSSQDEMEYSKRYADYRARVEATSFPSKNMLESDKRMIRFAGAAIASWLEGTQENQQQIPVEKL